MIGYLCLFALSFFLVKSFYKTCVFIMIWSLVLMNFNVGNDYTVWGLTSYVALLVFFHKIRAGDINIREFPFYKTYALLILSFVLAGFSLKIGPVGSIIAFFLYPLVSWMAKDKINRYWRSLLINLSIFSIIIISIGLYELYMGFNPVALYLESQNIMTFREVDDEYIRFGMYRCRSLTAWCSTYGVACGFTMIAFLYATYYRRFTIALLSYILCALLLIGVISSGTRSVYTAVCIGLLPLILNYASKFKYIMLLLVIIAVVYFNNQELFDEIIDSFIHSDEAGGSSVEMRQSQFEAAYHFYIRHPLFGNGIGAVGEAMQKNAQLLGAESCIYIIMIDRGLFGFLAYGLFNIQMIWYLYKNRKYRVIMFIPIAILIGKIISAFIDINEVYPIFWISILVKATDDYIFENVGKRIKINVLGLIKIKE